MNDRDGNRSNPYKPDPAMCCEACVFGRGEHAEWCGHSFIYRRCDGCPDLPGQSHWHCEPKPRNLNADAASYALSFVTHA